MSFHVGQKVVCVDDSPNTCWHPAPFTKGKVYTIARICHYVGLVEVDRGLTSWRSNRFRPVKTTSIEIFRQMLVKPPREVVDA